MEYILQTENLSKVYGAKTVLNHVSIHVPKGSIYGLVGKNGAGKTTLMRIICGLTQQSEGSYTLLGKTDDETVRRNVGMLIEKPGIYEHMTALENLRYFSLLFGIGDREHQRILEMVGLQNAGKKKASQFSLGMKQRLGIAIALLGNPDFLILDEPINGLDPEGVYEMRKMLEMLNREHGTTIMIASHILSELHKLATDYAIIDGGCLINEFSKDTLESACSSSVQIMVEPEYLQNAKMLIASRYPDVRCEILSNQKLRLYEKIDPADLNQFLVEHKVRVCGLGANDEDIERFLWKSFREGRRYEEFNSRSYLSTKKRSFLFGCLALACILLGSSIRLSFSLASMVNPVMGVQGLFDIFLGGDTVLYVFMLLTANIVAETYRSGAIKNIIGRGIAKKQYYLSIAFLVSAAYLLVMLAGSVVMGILVGSKFGMGGIPYPAYYALAVIARILFAIAHISFALTTTIYTRNAITGTVFGFVIPNIPKILEMVLGFFRIPIDLGFIKISTYMPSGYSASNDLSSFLLCFAVLCGYLIVSVFAGLRLLNRQDVK